MECILVCNDAQKGTSHWNNQNYLLILGHNFEKKLVISNLFLQNGAHIQIISCLLFLLFFISMNKQRIDFAETNFIFKSSFKLCWKELQDKPDTLVVWQWSLQIARWTFSRFLSFQNVIEGEPDHGWYSSDISSRLKSK